MTQLLGKILRRPDRPSPHEDLLFESRIRGVFSRFATDAKLIREEDGFRILIRPKIVDNFMIMCRKQGIDQHPLAIELEERFRKEADFFLEFRTTWTKAG